MDLDRSEYKRGSMEFGEGKKPFAELRGADDLGLRGNFNEIAFEGKGFAPGSVQELASTFLVIKNKACFRREQSPT